MEKLKKKKKKKSIIHAKWDTLRDINVILPYY